MAGTWLCGSGWLGGEFCSAPTRSVPCSLLPPLLFEKCMTFFPKMGSKLVDFCFPLWVAFAAGCSQVNERFREDLHLCVLVLCTQLCSSGPYFAGLGVQDLVCRCHNWGFRSGGRAAFELLGYPWSGETMHMQ